MSILDKFLYPPEASDRSRLIAIEARLIRLESRIVQLMNHMGVAPIGVLPTRNKEQKK